MGYPLPSLSRPTCIAAIPRMLEDWMVGGSLCQKDEISDEEKYDNWSHASKHALSLVLGN
jgi:hypothetical protein